MSSWALYVGTSIDVFEITEGASAPQVRALGTDVRDTFMDGARAVLVARDGTLYVGSTTKGVLRSQDGGTSWEPVNEGITYRNVWSLAEHPTKDLLYAGTEPANLFVSDDRGESWRHLTGIRDLPGTKDWFFPKPPHIAHVRGITINPLDPEEIFCAIEDGWLVRSTDGGATWAEVREGVDVDAHLVTYLPPDFRTIYASTGHYGFRSTDGGSSFEPSHEGIEGGYMTAVVVHPDRPEVLLTAAARTPGTWWGPGEGGQAAVFRSKDRGMTWERCRNGLPEQERAGTWAIAGDPGDPDNAFVGLADGRIWCTRDGGDSFSELTQLPAPILTMACARRG